MSFLCAFAMYPFQRIRQFITGRRRRGHDFLRDHLEFQDVEDTLTAPSIRSLKCPQCRHSGSFKIQVKEFLLIFHDYLELDRSHRTEWGAYFGTSGPPNTVARERVKRFGVSSDNGVARA